jgi:tryptophan-rich sensory protein
MLIPTLVAAACAIVVLLVGGLATKIGPWYESLRKPSWNPPNWLFGPMWTLIAALAVWSAANAWVAAPQAHGRILILFGLNAVLHMAWSPLFFLFKRPDRALIEVPCLWLSVLALVIGLAPLSLLSALLLLPYLLWVSVAAALNLTIVRLNAPFGLPERA